MPRSSHRSFMSARWWGCAAIALTACVLLPGLGFAEPIRIPIEDDSTSAPFVAPSSAQRARAEHASAMQTFSGCSTVNLPLSVQPGDQIWTAEIPDGAGGMFVAWQDPRNNAVSGIDIYAQHILICGSADPTWPAGGVALTTAVGNQTFPVLVNDGAGGAFAIWMEGSFPFPAQTDISAQHLLGSGVVDPSWPVNGVAVCTAPGQQVLPKAAPDGGTGAFVTWDDRRTALPPRHVFVQHLLSSGVDPAWTVDGNRACLTTTSQQLPEVCSDGAGGAIVAWSEIRTPATGRDIFAQHMSATGALLWTSSGQPVTTAPGIQVFVGAGGAAIYLAGLTEAQAAPVVPDGAGGCFLTWQDDRTFGATRDDIYAQHLTSSGTVAAGWSANGVAACTDPLSQVFSTMLSDGAGGAIVTWDDARPGVFVQHISSSGVADGPAIGLLISTAAFDTKRFPIGVADGSGGGIFAWYDSRNGDDDIIAQHVTTAGGLAVDPGWQVDGVNISTAFDGQGAGGSGWACSDGAGGAFFTWEDLRDFGTNGIDAYTQKVLASGVLPEFSVSGHVFAKCPSVTGFAGVTVDAFLVGTGDMVGTTVTGSGGSYSFSGLCWGASYTITAVAPLGFLAEAQDIPANGCSGAIDFTLDCLAANGTPNSMGYWKHQVGVATGGNGVAQVNAATLCSYLDLIAAHFNSNAINQVIVYQPPASGTCADKLQVAKTLLNLQGSASMIARARQQLMSLLLNVASNAISQTRVISADGATVSQAITYSDNLIDSPTGNYEKAKTICDMINNGQLVPAGMIPLGTQTIAYAAGRGTLQFRVTPNPGRGPLRFQFSVRKTESVELIVFDVAGRAVAKLVDGTLEAGAHTVTWNDSRSADHRDQNGVFFARLRTRDEGSEVVSVLRLRP